MKLRDYGAALLIVALIGALALAGAPVLRGQDIPLGPPMPATHKVLLTMVPMDARGNSTAIYGVPAWTVSDATLATITPLPVEGGAVPMSAWLEPRGVPGEVTVTVSADADPTAAIRPVVGTIRITIQGDAVSATIGVGTPVKK
jgi:hypothetical protein